MSTRARSRSAPVASWEVAEQVAADNNNPALKGWMRLCVEMMQRSGFVMVRSE